MASNLNSISRQLRSRDEEDRRQAVEELKAMDTYEALELAGLALGDESWRVRKSAVEVFQWFPDGETAIQNLLTALDDQENAGRRSSAVEALVGMGARAVPVLIRSLAAVNSEVRKFMVDILGEIKDASAVSELKKLIADEEENVRLAAVEALGNIGDDHAYGALLSILEKGDLTLVFSALHSLSRIGREVPVPVIRSLLDVKILKRAVYELLGNSQSTEAVELLAQGLNDQSKSTRQAAIRSMSSLLHKSLENGLERAIEGAVQKAWSGDEIALLREFVDSNQVHTKRSAVSLLCLVPTTEALNLLFEMVEDDAIQGEICQALERFKSRWPAVFEKQLKVQDPRIQSRVYQLVVDLRAPAAAPLRRIEPIAPQPMTDEEFQWLRNSVADYCGLYFDDDLKYLVERRSLRRMEALSIKTFRHYIDLLKKPSEGPTEMDNIVSVLSTNETYFFREEFQLRAFRDEILPEIKERKLAKKDRGIRIWSAGCATGEEPYTIAILLQEQRGLSDFNIEIMASDISAEVIKKARAGLYTPSSFRVMDEFYTKHYFTKENGTYRMQERIRNMVKFNEINLMTCREAPELGNLDIIFCRNVLIYFSLEAKKRVVGNFYHLLRPGGFLLLGHSESLMNISTKFTLRHFKNDLVYQKPERARSDPQGGSAQGSPGGTKS